MATPPVIVQLGVTIKQMRLRIGWTQRELARRADVSQALVSAIENGRLPTLTFATAARLIEVMGGRLIIDATQPFLADRERQRDAGHARCETYAARRLEVDGWLVETEVEVAGDRSRGWIDLLAFHPPTRTLLVVEIKTELHDLGAIERSLGWYQRESWSAARRLGWRPARVVGCLLILATEANDRRIRENSGSLRRSYPLRWRELASIVAGHSVLPTPGCALAMLDPRSRRVQWIRSTRDDGRRSPAPYADYIDFMTRLQSRAWLSRPAAARARPPRAAARDQAG
ncbi:MAG: helix-turn-helix domain-containing protein [Chloroflexi bacterium]|nr:helix-turn-helix domain-containing protein [Chloroflexota bacterium]